MAITQYTEPATVNPSLTDWQNSIARDNASSRGFAEVDLSSYADGATAPTVAVGSRFDNNGALYVVATSNESISGIAGIANSTTFYVYYDVSAGVFLASTTAPTFDNEKRGWYNGNDRALFRIYKDSGGEYDQRSRYVQEVNVGSDVRFTGSFDTRNITRTLVSDTAITQNTIFDFLSPYIPNDGDEIMASGVLNLTATGDSLILSSFNRFSSTRIYARTTRYRISTALSAVLDEVNIDDGSASDFTSCNIAIFG